MAKSLRPVSASGRGKDWALAIDFERDEDAQSSPPYVRLAHAIARAIQAGRLPPGTRLPGSRVLADALGLHRNTVLRAHTELMAEGWITSEHGRGTFVSAQLPELDPKAFVSRKRHIRAEARRPPLSASAVLPYPLVPWNEPPLPYTDTRFEVQLMGGLGDLRLLPMVTLGRAYRRALQPFGRVLSYGDPRGQVRLRSQIAEMLRRSRGLALDQDGLLITHGSQMALYLAARAICTPGAIVAVERLGYRPAWEALRLAGADLAAVEVDAEGLVVEALVALCKRRAVRAVYVTPHHHYPTTVALSPARRMALLEAAREYGFAILEDDYDHEFQYEGQPWLPLASADSSGSVVYIGTLSKVLAPGFRLGYLVAPAAVVRRVTALRFLIDRQGDAVTEGAIAELMEEGEAQRHVRRVRRVYQARRDHFVAHLRSRFGEALEFQVPEGGMALWAQAHGVDVRDWLEASRALSVDFQIEPQFVLTGESGNHARLGYAVHNEAELERAVTRLARAWQQCRKQRRKEG
jgi:GntR family transcriptional regulator / MocR family aminotransferase